MVFCNVAYLHAAVSAKFLSFNIHVGTIGDLDSKYRSNGKMLLPIRPIYIKPSSTATEPNELLLEGLIGGCLMACGPKLLSCLTNLYAHENTFTGSSYC